MKGLQFLKNVVNGMAHVCEILFQNREDC